MLPAVKSQGVRTRTAFLLITSDHSGVAGGCLGLQNPHSQAAFSASGCPVVHLIAFPVLSEWYQLRHRVRTTRSSQAAPAVAETARPFPLQLPDAGESRALVAELCVGALGEPRGVASQC